MSKSILLYRFLTSVSALKSIEGRRLRVGRIAEFNDPFEWRLGITGITPEGQIVAEACVNAFIKKMNAEIGIFCFSDTGANSVLWSHYADSHRGVAFECDYLIEPGKLHKVVYTDDRPVLDANRLNDTNGRDKYLRSLVMKLISQKSCGWKYEREYRVHDELADCDISGGHFFRKIPDSFVKRIILGYRSPLEELYVRKALDCVGLNDTEVPRAKLSQLSYKVEF